MQDIDYLRITRIESGIFTDSMCGNYSLSESNISRGLRCRERISGHRIGRAVVPPGGRGNQRIASDRPRCPREAGAIWASLRAGHDATGRQGVGCQCCRASLACSRRFSKKCTARGPSIIIEKAVEPERGLTPRFGVGTVIRSLRHPQGQSRDGTHLSRVFCRG